MSFSRRRLQSSLLVPRDVVLLGELVGELAQVVEAEARPDARSTLHPSSAAKNLNAVFAVSESLVAIYK